MNEDKKTTKEEVSPDVLYIIEQVTKRLEKMIRSRGGPVFRRYPLTFSLLGTLGIASVIYGFEKTVDQIPALSAHPVIIFITGLVLLIITGTLYKRLQSK